jgi:hypothetical protein
MLLCYATLFGIDFSDTIVISNQLSLVVAYKFFGQQRILQYVHVLLQKLLDGAYVQISWYL